MAEKILVIDDDLDSLKLIGLLLQRQGYQVIVAPGGALGLTQAEKENPDLILLDIMMPGMDGYQVCRRLRQNPRLAHIPIIMFTAKTRVDDKVAGFEAGADDYLTKPTHPAELASRIKALLTRSATVRSAVIQRPRGKVVAILGIKGGSGVTTLAINLSAAIAKQIPNLTLADLQHGMGAIGLQLGYFQGAGLSMLLQSQLKKLTHELVKEALVEYAPGMRLLLAAYNPTEAAVPLPAGHVERIVDLLAETAEWVVLDLGSRIGGATAKALKAADLVLLCLSPQRTSLVMAQTLLQHMKQSGLHRERTHIVLVNTTPSAPAANLQQIETQLQLPVLGNIPPAPEVAMAALEQGQPMVSMQPDSPTAEQFRVLAQRIIANLGPAE